MLRHALPGTLALLCASLFPSIPPDTLPQPALHTTPMEISHGKPFVMVSIHGRGPYRFVVDTGTSGQALISPSLASELGLTQIGHMRITDPSGRGGRTTPLVLIPALELANVEFTNIQAALHAFDDNDGVCQGLLGFELFRNLLLTLDYPHRRLELTTGTLTPDGEQSVLPFRIPSGIPLVTLRIRSATGANTLLDTLLDSGGAGLSLPESLAAHMSFSSAPVRFSNSFSLTTRFQLKAGRLAETVHLGAYTFERPFVEINPAFPIANFGAVPMQNFAVTFDQRSSLVRFESARKNLPLAATPTPLHPENSPLTLHADQALIPVG